jgi:hypothetical protein
MNKLFLTAAFLVIAFCNAINAQQVKQQQLVNFAMQSSAVVGVSGEELSSPGYLPTQHW